MANGYQITLMDNGRQRTFKAAISGLGAAIDAASSLCSNPTDVVVMPLTDADLERLGLKRGEIVEINRP